MEIKDLQKLLTSYHIELTDQMIASFSLYSKLLEEWNEKINLTAIDPEEYVEKHYYDSLLVVKTFSFDNQSVLDIGTGAGFPGIPLKIVFPDIDLVLVEPTAKRCLFLQEVVDQLGLKKVKILNYRAEDLGLEYRESFDIVLARAVANLAVILELSIPFVKVDGVFIALKGPNAKEELEMAKHAIKTLSTKLIKLDESTLPSDESLRLNCVFLKLKPTNIKYPRNYAQIKRKPL